MKSNKGRIFLLILILTVAGFAVGGIFAFISPSHGIKDVSGRDVKDTSSEKLDSSGSNGEELQSDALKSDVLKEVTTEKEPLSIVAVGDIMLGRGVGSRLDKQSAGYTYAFEKVTDLLKQGDVIFGNLEGPITDKTHSLTALSKSNKNGKFVLKGSVKSFETLKYAGFNMLSLANNHILDYYHEGLFDTMKIFEENGIAFSGAGKNLEDARKPAVIEKKGLKIGLLSYTDYAHIVYEGNPKISFAAAEDRAGVVPRKYEYIREDVARAQGKFDILMVSLHWGVEESFDILPEQIELAHDLIDSGVDVILGHHPHQFQGMEIYKGKPIFYSLGNFIFDQNDPENQESFIVNMQFNGTELSAMSAIPVRTIDKTQVIPVYGDEAKELLKREVELSSKLDTNFKIENDKLVLSDIANF